MFQILKTHTKSLIGSFLQFWSLCLAPGVDSGAGLSQWGLMMVQCPLSQYLLLSIIKQPLLILNLLKFQLVFQPAVAGSSWCLVAWPQLTWLGCIWSSNLFDVLKLPKNQTLVLVYKMMVAPNFESSPDLFISYLVNIGASNYSIKMSPKKL